MTSVAEQTRLESQPCHPKQRTISTRSTNRDTGFLWRGVCRVVFLVLVMLSCGIPCSEAQVYNGLFTPPPQTGNKPQVANNIVYYLYYIPKHCQEPYVSRYPSGGIVQGKRALLKRDNPHIIRGNIEIPPSACLWIEPGCELRFGPGYGIIVNGTLIARGSEEDGGRITMTKADGEDTGAPTGDWKYDARLSDGNTTQDGRLDLLYKGKWRGICTNYQNFTEMDVNVTCRHLGFLKGNFTYHSFARNLTDYMLWDKPGCTGNEDSLFHCPGTSRIRVGAHICDGQQVVGFECEGLRPGLAVDHWRGIEFFNSSSHRVHHDDIIFLYESWSWLEYVDLLYPGLDIFHGRTSEYGIYYPKAAISASPLVPLMNNVTIKYGAYDGFNLTEVTGPIHIANSTVHKCRGNGIFIKTPVGLTLINTTTVTENWGDGIKFYISNLTIHDFRQNFSFASGFCYQSSSQTTLYPIFEHLDAVSFGGEKLIGRYCLREFFTTKEKSINLHFLLMEKDPEASGKLIVRDGDFGTATVIDIANGSFPQSIRTWSQKMTIRFEYNLPRRGCKIFKPCIRFLLRLSTSNGTEDEFRMIYSKVSDNIGYGVNIQNIRSKVFFNTSEVSRNHFGAGIRVYQGAGEVIINSTRLEGNAGCGINITYSGGYQLINNTELIRNKGYGIITEYLQLNRSRIESMQKLEIVRAKFMYNELIGLRVGNYCRGGVVFVNESHFNYNLDEAIEYLSCNVSTGTFPQTNFSVAFTEFTGNVRHAILMKPLVNTVGIITNCTFTNHSLGTLRIDNGYDLLISKWYREFPVEYYIFQNQFRQNSGRYVVSLRLTDKSPKHKMYFKFNSLTDNSIQKSFIYTNPRSRANAVAVVSSGNIVFKRNVLANRQLSVRELSTHLLDPSVTIDATENHWNIEIYRSSQYEVVHNTIFDQDDRYNLARFNYHPALQTDRVYDDALTYVKEFRWSFSRANNVIGGVLDYGGFRGQEGKTYYVDRDIYVFPGQVISLPPRVTLEFAPSVGMVIHGVLKADGVNSDGTIHFKLWNDPDLLPLENRTASVRLSNGTDLYEGRLEVFINDEWGTVCNEGWTEREATLVCLQLGLIYNPQQGQASVQMVAPPGMKVLMSWISCDEVDMDLTRCRAVGGPEVSCDHDQDVYLRCQDPTWAGVTLPATTRLGQETQPRETQLRHLHLERAGLLDSETMSFTPALRIDYNYYIITAVTVTNSLSDGVLINYNYPYETPRLEYMQIHNNQGNGVVTRYPRLDLRHSNISNSKKAGFLYDPFFSEYDALSVRSMIHDTKRKFITDTSSEQLPQGGMMFLLCPAGDNTEDHHVYNTEISTDFAHRIVLQLLDYFPVTEIEEVTVFDSPRANIGLNTRRWRIPQDLVDFPVMSTGNQITIQLTVRGLRSGRLSFAAISQQRNSGRPDLKTHLFNNTLLGNNQGLQTRHYNNPSNRRLEVFHRFQLETIVLERINIQHSKKEAIFMPSVTKFSDDYIPTYEDMTRPERVATIRYNITQGIFQDNAAGIVAEHNHVDFANNVWQWSLNDTRLERTASGGVQIEVPRVNDATNRARHSISIIETKFLNNQDFSFAIKGYYADLRIDNNKFENNKCLIGLITISGMEKNMLLISNHIKNNIGRYMLDVNIPSHSEYSESVTGIMEYNDIRSNQHRGLIPPGLGNSPKTYAVAFRGVQNMTANKNLFDNPDLGYELVAGVTALSLGNPLDVRKNFWGQTYYDGIMERIFDFDDWNSYAIAEFFPFLTDDKFEADLSGGEPPDPPLKTDPLGGQVREDEVLAYRTKPYIVTRDLTIMPDATLTIPAGVELQFRPNVGILVLGRLIARGVEYNRIKMWPVQAGADPFPGSGDRKKRAATSTVRLRGDGTLFKDSGFLEMYNASTKTWNMMCDSQFNEKSAEVVCRQLGKETINVRVRYTHLYDHYIYGEPQYFLKEFWFEAYFCRGDETDLKQCTTRYNYNLQQCIRAANYTFIQCGESNLEPGSEHWGNLRFARNAYQELSNEIGRKESILEFVDIEGAGMLHGEKVGAIQTTYVSPRFRNINITKCAENGLDVIVPRGNINMHRLHVFNNLGFGFNFLILNGESNVRDSSFVMLGSSTIPYHVYGLVEICRMEKEIVLNTRMILYYKYGPAVRDCVKIIHSGSPRKKIGLRFLQVNMFHEDFSRNVVEIFDGSTVSKDTSIKEIVANTSSEDLKQLYTSTGDTLTVHLHASVSHGSYGFIAEVVQVPLSLTGLPFPNTDYKHEVLQSISSKNQGGAFQYKNVGEGNPSLFIDQCWIEDNGVAILNLTSPPTIDISLQGTVLFRFASNSVSRNKGGMYLHVYTQSSAIALRGNITNNIFSYGTNGEALNITGHYYQRLYMFQNYIFNYTAGDWRDVVHIRDVVVNYTYNYLDNNTGNYILNTFNSDNQQAQQLFTRSGFIRNNATALTESTIKIGRGRPFFENNYIVNKDNDFEMETYPKLDPADRAIDARSNWWGSELRSYINGKLWENSDDPKLVPISFWQPRFDNRSVVEGLCSPGWKELRGRCYRFMGGALPYFEAQAFCRQVGAFLAEGRDHEGFFNYLLRLMRDQNNFKDRVWVMSEVGSSSCSALEYSHIVYEEDCWNLLYPFICEKNPFLAPPPGLESSVKAMVIGIGVGVGGVLILIVIILGVLWCVKSKRREKERFERTASMRSSMRMSKSTLTNLSEGPSRRRLNEIDAYSQASSGGTKASRGTEDLNGSVASLSYGYRNGRAAVVPDCSLADRRGTERDRRQEREWDRERDREREMDMRRGRRYQRGYEDQEESGESRGKEETESEDEDKKEFDNSEEEEDSFDSDPEEQEGEEEAEEEEARGGWRPTNRLYQNNGVPLPGMGHERSEDIVYKNEDGTPARSKPMKSFSQPADPDESPVANIYLPHPDLPTPPPTPHAYGNIDTQPNLSQAALRPRVAPKPATRPPLVHPGVDQLRNSPALSENSGSGRPSPLPRKNIESSQGSSPRETPVPYEASNDYPSYQNHAASASPISTKPPMGSMEFLPRSKDPSEAGDFDYKPRTPHMSPSNRLPNLPRYSPPLPMECPPSYEESDQHYPYPMHEPEYLSQEPPTSYQPSSYAAPEQDVQYLPRYQPDQRQFQGSRDRLGGSRDRLDENRDRYGGSQDRLDGNRDRHGGSRDRLDENRDRYGGSRDRLDENRDRYGGSRDRLDGNRDRYGGSRDRLDENRDRYGGSRDRLDENRDRYGGSRDRLDGNRDRHGGSRDRLDENRDRYGGSRDRLDGNRDRHGGSRDRLDENRDRYGGSRDRLDGNRDRHGGSRDRLDRNRDRHDENRDRLGGSREHLQRSRDRLNINQPYRNPATGYPPGVLYLNNDGRGGGSHLETEI